MSVVHVCSFSIATIDNTSFFKVFCHTLLNIAIAKIPCNIMRVCLGFKANLTISSSQNLALT